MSVLGMNPSPRMKIELHVRSQFMFFVFAIKKLTSGFVQSHYDNDLLIEWDVGQIEVKPEAHVPMWVINVHSGDAKRDNQVWSYIQKVMVHLLDTPSKGEGMTVDIVAYLPDTWSGEITGEFYDTLTSLITDAFPYITIGAIWMLSTSVTNNDKPLVHSIMAHQRAIHSHSIEQTIEVLGRLALTSTARKHKNASHS